MQLLNSIKKSPYVNILFKTKNFPFVIVFLATYISFISLFFVSLQYSQLNMMLYFVGFIIVLLLILLATIAMYDGLIENNKKMKLVGLLSLAILLFVFSFGNYVILRINSSINEAIVDVNQSTTFEVAFVTYQNDSIVSIDDMNNVKLGILSNTEGYDRNGYVKSEVELNSLNITYLEYQSYTDMLMALFSNKIDVAALPANYVNQFEDNEGFSDYFVDTSIIHQYTVVNEGSSETASIDVIKDPITILIMGNDGERTDSMILATYNPLKLSVTMTSIARDSYVPIACYPNQAKDKIGHAFAVSQECAIDTVENLFEIEIDFYVSINFQGVVDIVDALGGVQLESPVTFVGQTSSYERGTYTVWVPEGVFWADGEQALALARERHHMPNGDYDRQINQQQVMTAIIDSALNMRDVNSALSVLDAAGSNVKTNMTLNQMITIFNNLLKASTKTNIEPAYILDIVGSRVLGYSSYHYSDEYQLPLWIMIPYEGSIADMKELINSNLTNSGDYSVTMRPIFDANAPLYQPDYFSTVYDEKEVHEVLPDFMKTMAFNDWTLADVNAWARTRGITIVVDEVEAGDKLFDSTLPFNYIVSQSVKYGVRVSNFNTLTVGVIKYELDCSIKDNMQFDECKYKMPDFVGQDYTIVQIQEWARVNGKSLKTINIAETDARYNKSKIGYVISVSPSVVADFRTISELTIEVMDSNYSVTIPNTSTWTKDTAIQWVADNLMYDENYTLVPKPTTDTTLINKVFSTTPTSGTTMKIANSLQITYYVEGWKMLDFVTLGSTKTDLTTNYCLSGGSSTAKFACNFTDVATTDSTQDGKVASQDVARDTLKSLTDWKSTTVTFGVYKYTAPTTSGSGT